jgi:DNA-directed RNA polymerase subunit RPC12/RpoP
MSRNKPYTTNQKTWKEILDENLIIPMNQRQYAWEEKELEKFMNDMIYIYSNTNYVEKMGSIILFTGNNGNKEIYDGQQRTITIIILLIVLSKKYEKLKSTIETLILVDKLLNTFSKEHEKLIQTNDDSFKIPKIYCINPYDQEALMSIVNDKFESYYKYNVGNINLDETNDGHIKYKCSKCNTEVLRYDNFIRHLEVQCKISSPKIPNKNTKIYNAYNYIYYKICGWNQTEKQTIQFYQFIIKEMDIQLYESSDPIYVSKIFDWENNRGLVLTDLDIIKNLILTKVSEDKKYECYDKWCRLKDYTNDVYKNFGQRLFYMGIQIYNKTFEIKFDIYKNFNKIINSDNVYKELLKFFRIIEKCIEIFKQIQGDRFGKLITTTSRINTHWEIFNYFLLPVFYTNFKTKLNNADQKCLELLTKWHFRKLCCKVKTSEGQGLQYSNPFIEFTNKYLTNESSTDYFEFMKNLIKNRNNNLYNDKQNFVSTLTNNYFNISTSTYILYFLETCETNDNRCIEFNYTLEHIYPQNKQSTLSDSNNINKIGNLTLLEGNNSKNGHKGNSSLKDKSFSHKLESYKGSSIFITRKLAETYTLFTESKIIERTNYIAERIEKITQIE